MLYLASSSPRRADLLREAGIAFALAQPGPEPVGDGSPAELARLRARAKALGARAAHDEGVVRAADRAAVAPRLHLHAVGAGAWGLDRAAPDAVVARRAFDGRRRRRAVERDDRQPRLRAALWTVARVEAAHLERHALVGADGLVSETESENIFRTVTVRVSYPSSSGSSYSLPVSVVVSDL